MALSWSSDPQKIATIPGKIRAVRPIDLAGDGKLLLFVAADQGDHLLACDAKSRKFTDITAARRLQSKSQAYAWGDFDGKGRLDLISFDGKALTLHAQQADGTFQARPLDLAAALASGCIGLSALDCGTKRKSGLLLSTNSWPVLVSFAADGKPSLSKLAAAGIDLKRLGKAGPCLVADFDGDGMAGVLAPFAAGSVLFRGLAAGKFAPGVACAVQLGAGQSARAWPTSTADGRFDVLCVSTDGLRLWQNEGDGKFTDALNLSGEIAYISKPGGIDCLVGDINNDGRQDALIAYSAMSPQLFFNRGYRSFGHAHTLDLAERQLLPAAEQGQQSACLGDFDGDGAQDMVLALTNGELWVFFRENDDHEARSVVAALPIGGPYKGPLAVTGWIGKRCLGAWNVVPGAPRHSSAAAKRAPSRSSGVCPAARNNRRKSSWKTARPGWKSSSLGVQPLGAYRPCPPRGRPATPVLCGASSQHPCRSMWGANHYRCLGENASIDLSVGLGGRIIVLIVLITLRRDACTNRSCDFHDRQCGSYRRGIFARIAQKC